MNAQIIARLPTPSEYRILCEAVGWGHIINFDAAPQSLARSVFGVVAVQAGITIGMGRIIGDDVMYFYVQDIAVLPDYQGQGIGTRLMDALMAYVQANAADKAFVGLYAAPAAIRFYERYGFSIPPADDLTGMFQVVQRPPRPQTVHPA